MSTQWAYKVVDAQATGFRMLKSEDIETVLNQHGMLGWELVEVIQMAGNQATLYFKKPK